MSSPPVRGHGLRRIKAQGPVAHHLQVRLARLVVRMAASGTISAAIAVDCSAIHSATAAAIAVGAVAGGDGDSSSLCLREQRAAQHAVEEGRPWEEAEAVLGVQAIAAEREHDQRPCKQLIYIWS